MKSTKFHAYFSFEHTGAVKLVEALGMKEVVKLTRMYRNGHPGHLSEKVFGLTSTFICGY